MGNECRRIRSTKVRPALVTVWRRDERGRFRDAPIADACAVFEQRTGLRPFPPPGDATEPETLFQSIMLGIGQALNEAAQPASKRLERRDGGPEVGFMALVPTATRRGRTALPANLVALVRALVDWFGPQDAALACMLFRLHRHEAWPCSLGGRDVTATLRRSAKRLWQIARA